MQTLSQNLDKQLTDLSWSLWTELGVAGVTQNHQQFLIFPEELILLTALLSEKDPRLMEEALDWCSRYHRFISVSRMKMLAKAWGKSAIDALSIFSASLNSVSRANWPLLSPANPLKFKPSGKSKPPRFENPALLLFRLRSLFGVGARADLIAYFLAQKKSDYAISDATEIGYTKRNLADVFESFVRAGIFDLFLARNQQRYRFLKRDEIAKMLSPFPQFMPPWRKIFEVILKLRECIRKIEKKSDSTKIVEIRNVLMDMEEQLTQLNLTPPPMQPDFHIYWDSFCNWILGILPSLAEAAE